MLFLRKYWFAKRLPSPISYRRGGAPAPFFFTLGLREPRGSVRFGLGGRLFRAARFTFLRSALSLMFLVFINVISTPFSAPCYAFSNLAYCAMSFFWP